MSASNRAAKLQKIHKALKKLYQPVKPPADRNVLEHLIYACCLEDASYLTADEALAQLQETYLDWNEVRVTTVVELAECLACLKAPEAAAKRVKNTLHSVFETYYSWDLEFLKKENLGKAIQKLQSYKSVSPFVVSYVAQTAFNGHSIPIDDAALVVLYALDVIDENELRDKQVPGLERAIPKSKGIEFGSLLHQLAADLYGSPYSPDIRNRIIAIDPAAKNRLPKRPSRKKAKSAEAKAEQAATPETPSKTKADAKELTSKKDGRKKAAESKSKEDKKKDTKKSSKTADASTTKKKTSSVRLAKKKPR